MVRVKFADSSLELKPGEGYFVNADVLHGIICWTDRPCRYRSIVFEKELISGQSGSVFDEKYITPFIKESSLHWFLSLGESCSANVISQFQKAFHACQLEPEGFEFIVREAMTKVTQLLNRQRENITIRAESIQEQRMKAMLNWIDEHYMEEVRVEHISGAADISVRECQRTFAAIIQDTPIRYLIRRRIVMAAEILRFQTVSVGEASERCGFESQSYFTKLFREMMGMTPKQYQKNKVISLKLT